MTGGPQGGLTSYTFTNSVFDDSGIDTIVLYYHIGQIISWDDPINEESWIQWRIVSYDDVTYECSATVQFNPTIYEDYVYAFFWANDTFGHTSRGGLDGFMYDGPTIPSFWYNNISLGIFIIVGIGVAGVLFIIKRKI